MMKKFRFIIGLLLCSLCVTGIAINNASSKKLSVLSPQIVEALHHLKQTLKQQNALQKKLKRSEQSIGSLSNNIRRINSKILKNNQHIAKLQSQAQHDQQQLKKQRADLTNQIRLAYQTNHENYMKVLFNQQNPYQLSRIMAYYGYFSQAHLQAITEINQTLTNLQQTQQSLNQNTNQLKKLLHSRIKQQQQLRQSRTKRKKVLTRLDSRVETQHQKIAILQTNKQALEKVIAKLRQQKTRKPFVGGNFASNKGRLSWPTRGTIMHRFGTRMNQSLRYYDVFIKAPEGQGIHAIAPGKVIFSNWLKGFGLLLIVDHGNGYMTLYAHCNSLYKNVGDTITSGEPIASVGNSGGMTNVGLSFQIRHNGKPLDPNRWCA